MCKYMTYIENTCKYMIGMDSHAFWVPGLVLWVSGLICLVCGLVLWVSGFYLGVWPCV